MNRNSIQNSRTPPQITGPRRLRLPTIPGANLLLQLQPNQVVENLPDQNRLPTQTARLK